MTVIVPTNDPGATSTEYESKGYHVGSIYAKPNHRALCDPNLDGGKMWAISFWKPDPPKQPELFGFLLTCT